MKLSINRQNLTIASLENRVAILTLVPEEYDLLRQRFLSKCKQKVGKCTKKDWVIIQAGNAVAHGGDAVADSRLYLKSKRLDGEIFRELYGLDVLVVPLLSTEIISVLNLFFFFHDLFNKFIQLFMESEFGETFLTVGGGELKEVYDALIDISHKMLMKNV
ncbi:hypothetical protein FPQ18DRAFT_97055 [Pyronema domesticum]|nr:hypothetical protein FPQ18DRAFT_97055 [Pyronema domesticum]